MANTLDSLLNDIWADPNAQDINVGVSSRHIHVSQEHIIALFGKELTCYKDLSQPGQYACNEKVDLVGPKGRIDNVRVLGPARKASQIEISKTDSFILGIDAPLRMSDDLDGTPGILIIGKSGEVLLEKGVIVPKRHIHMTKEDADNAKVADGQVVWIATNKSRKMIIGDIIVRVSPKFALDFHIDTDEANAAWLSSGDKVRIVR